MDFETMVHDILRAALIEATVSLVPHESTCKRSSGGATEGRLGCECQFHWSLQVVMSCTLNSTVRCTSNFHAASRQKPAKRSEPHTRLTGACLHRRATASAATSWRKAALWQRFTRDGVERQRRTCLHRDGGCSGGPFGIFRRGVMQSLPLQIRQAILEFGRWTVCFWELRFH